ncbi:MAG: PAS domain S-box protein, partial [Sedimentisphaerales bacterium]|nr:PAS domain S-box protein [Sedimentisphaerales bacterium]
LDEASTTIYISPQIEKILGFKPEDYQADPNIWRKQLHPDDRQKVIEETQKTHQTGQPFSCGYRMFAKDGNLVWLWDEAVIVKNTSNEPLFLQGVVLDITKQKLAEEELKESEQRFRTIFDGAIDGLLLADTKTKKFFVANQALCKMLGYTSQEIINLSVKDIHPKDQLGYAIQEFEKQVQGEVKLAENVPVKRKDGSVFYVDINTARLTLAGKTYLMGVFRDITQKKQAEEQLELYREKMAHAEQLASLGTISATLSHELNQPLTAIRLFIENSLAEMEQAKQLPVVVDALKESLKEVENVASIVDRFRSFARQSSDKTICRVDVKNVLQKILALLDEPAQRANLLPICKNMNKLPPLYLNEKDLEQVFFALIENAIQAADGKKHKRLTISSNVKNGMLELKFADNCNGIPPENLDKIFEPFFTTKPPGEGTGLGLCIVQRILSGYGGKIRVESKPGKGATFYATLPIHQNNIG